MPRYVAFLRGINVAGQKRILMEELKVLFEVYGCEKVVTYIQSGNVVFDSSETDVEIVRATLEAFLEESYQYKIVTLVRSVDNLLEIIANNPFKGRVEDGEIKLYVHYLSEAPAPEKLSALADVLLQGEQIVPVGREIYFLTPAFGNTKLSNAFIEKKLGVSGTARNWATTTKVVTL
jgi:uncharacterized protein (DUF1697 family)